MSKTLPTLDSQWFERYCRIAAWEAYEYLEGEKRTGITSYRNQQKALFLKGEIEQPKLDYPHLTQEDLTKKERQLIDLKKDILEQEKNDTIQALYRIKINEKLAETRLLMAALHFAKDDNPNRFKRYSKFVYGKHNHDIYKETLRKFQGYIERAEKFGNKNLKEVATSLKKTIQDIDSSGEDFTVPDNIMELTHEHISQEFNGLFAHVNFPDGTFGSEYIKTIFEQVLKNAQLEDWQVVVESRTSIAVNHEKKAIQIPGDREVSEDQLRCLIVHEIGTHVLRRHNGENSQLQLLGLGLDRYIRGEEGIATMREEALMKKTDNSKRMMTHFAIALVNEGIAKNFRELFEIIKACHILQNFQKDGDFMETNKKAEDYAWKLCIRVFRGTDCQTSGVCFTKDVAYAIGNREVWKTIIDDPDILATFQGGKFDPSNSKHIRILQKTGILQESL